ELAQVDDRQQLAPHVGETLDPALGARHARGARGHAEHLAGLLARHQVQVAGHAQRHPDPLAPRRGLLVQLRGHGTPAPLEFGEQLEGPVPEGLQLGLDDFWLTHVFGARTAGARAVWVTRTASPVPWRPADRATPASPCSRPLPAAGPRSGRSPGPWRSP